MVANYSAMIICKKGKKEEKKRNGNGNKTKILASPMTNR
jgi:hypothetical protein